MIVFDKVAIKVGSDMCVVDYHWIHILTKDEDGFTGRIKAHFVTRSTAWPTLTVLMPLG